MVAKSSDEGKEIIQQCLDDGWGLPILISFDHDLGGDDTGFKFMWWLINGHLDEKWDLSKVELIQVHTANPVGAEKLTKLWESFCKSHGLECKIERVWPNGTRT